MIKSRNFIICSICFFLLLFISSMGNQAAATAKSEGMTEEDGATVIYKGSATAAAQNSNLTFQFTKHVGGKFDASKINEGSSFTTTYTGTKDGVYLALSSASGATQWVAVYPSETESNEDGSYTSTYCYEDFSKAFGTNFARLDQILAYTSTKEEVSLKEIAYVPGSGDAVDQSDGSWDRDLTGIAFIGDSIVQNALYKYGDWNQILGRTDCANYGIGAQTTVEVEARIKDLLKGSYEKIVVLCGINDIGHGITTMTTANNYRSMFGQIAEALPDAQVYVISLLPTTKAFYQGAQNQIVQRNKILQIVCEDYDFVTYVDCYSSFVALDGYCNPDYVLDGLHPNEKGYAVIRDILSPYLEVSVTEGASKEDTQVESGESTVTEVVQEQKAADAMNEHEDQTENGAPILWVVAGAAVFLAVAVFVYGRVDKKK